MLPVATGLLYCGEAIFKAHKFTVLDKKHSKNRTAKTDAGEK